MKNNMVKAPFLSSCSTRLHLLLMFCHRLALVCTGCTSPSAHSPTASSAYHSPPWDSESLVSPQQTPWCLVGYCSFGCWGCFVCFWLRFWNCAEILEIREFFFGFCLVPLSNQMIPIECRSLIQILNHGGIQNGGTPFHSQPDLALSTDFFLLQLARVASLTCSVGRIICYM